MSTVCSSNSYYDPNTGSCHSCSDCQPPRPQVGICIDQCSKFGSCPEETYYDSNAQRCYPCSECRNPITRNKFCSGCPEQLSTTWPATSPSPPEDHQRTIIVVVVVSFVLAFIVLGVLFYCCVKYLKRKRSDNNVVDNGDQNVNNGHIDNGELQPLKLDGQDTQQETRVEYTEQNEFRDSELPRGPHPTNGGSIVTQISQSVGVSLPAGGHQPIEGTVRAGGSMPGKVCQPSVVGDDISAEDRLGGSSELSSFVQEETAGHSSSRVLCSPCHSRQSSLDSRKVLRRVSFRTDSDDDRRSDIIAVMSHPTDETSAPSYVCPSKINNNHLPQY